MAKRTIEAYILASNNPLHTLYISQRSKSPTSLWILYIHGGAWQDPTQTKETGYPLLDFLSQQNENINTASIDYRLSPHPVHPPVSQTVTHPEHVRDVISAMHYLARVYAMERYVIVGHSAGAALAFQAAAGRHHWDDGDEEALLPVPGPLAIVGLEGIYDLELLIEEYPDYRDFVENAFGSSKKVWREASPAYMDLKGILSHKGISWTHEGEVGNMGDIERGYMRVLLIHSLEDELLSLRQTERMRDSLLAQLSEAGMKIVEAPINMIKVKGKHDEVPSSGEVLRIILGLINSI